MENRFCKRFYREASIEFNFFNLSRETHDAQVINYCKCGAYIESDFHLKPGATILLKMKSCEFEDADPNTLEGLRSISLAQVKWCKEMNIENAVRFGYGINYYF